MPFKCFLVKETNRYQYRLRRYCSITDGIEKCPKGSYHDASVVIGIVERSDHPVIESVELDDLGDEPWPTHCDSCGMEFGFSHCQRWYDQMFCAEDGREWPIRELPPGAIFHASWRDDVDKPKDGKAWAVILPDRQTWYIDSEPNNGGRWIRSGEPPLLTVSPSILTPGYHGFLKNGILTDDLDGRKFG